MRGGKRRKTKMGPKMRVGPRRGKSKGRVDEERKKKGEEEREEGEEEEAEAGRRRRRTVSRTVGLANG